MWSRLFKKNVVGERKLIFEQLEERIVLDAAPADAGNVDHDQQTHQSDQNPTGDDGAEIQEAAESAPAHGQSDSSDPLGDIFNQEMSVILISNSLDDVDALADAAVDGAEVVVYDAEQDNLSSLVGKLSDLVDSTGKEIGQLAILSHGAPGVLSLGGPEGAELWTADSLEADASNWSALGALLADDARIDLYGCNIGQGQEGVLFVEMLASMTDADVRASDDVTGNVEGADWAFEVTTGESTGFDLLDYSALAPDSIRLLTLTDGPDTLTIAAGDTYNEDIFMRAGDDTLYWEGGTVNGTIDGGNDTDTLYLNVADGITDITYNGTPSWGALTYDGTTITWKNFENVYLTGNDSDNIITLTDKSELNSLAAGDGADTITIRPKATVGYVYGEGGNDSITNKGTVSNTIDGGTGNDFIKINGSVGADIFGGDNADTIIVNALGIVSGDILGGGDNDSITIWGAVGSDVAGQDGDDTIYLGKDATVGNDVLGGVGADTITNYGSVVANIDGGDDNDTITNYSSGTIGTDLMGGSGADKIENQGTILNTIYGGTGNDLIKNNGSVALDIDGGDDADTITINVTGTVSRDVLGGDENDSITNRGYVGRDVAGQGGYDTILNDNDGVVGNDVLGGADADSIINKKSVVGNIDGGDADDTITNESSGSIGMNLTGGSGSDTIINLGTVTNTIDGGTGNDTIKSYGSVGADIDGGSGTDFIRNEGSVAADIDGGDDADTIINDSTGIVSNDILGGGGNDTITNSGTVNYLNGEAGADSITNAKQAVRIYGGTGNDEIILSSDSIVDRVYADDGDDTVTWDGGTVSEFIQGDSDNDKLVLRPANNVIQLDYDGTPSSGTLTYDGDTVSWASFEIVNLKANSKDNIITVTENSELNYLSAGAGADTITNRGSVTYLSGDGGNDSISHTGWAGYIYGGDDHDTIEVYGTVGYDVNADSGDDTVIIGLSGSVVGKARGKSGTDTLRWVFETDSDAIAFAAKNPAGDSFTDSTGKTVTWNTFEGLQTVLNSPPELDGVTYSVGATNEDSDLTIDVSDFANKITDADATAVKGIAITAIVGNGTWEYSIDGGTTWVEVGSVSATNALLLSAETNDNNLLRYTGDQENGEIASVSFQAWDQSASTNPGDYVDPTFTEYGLYSADTDTATITVTDVNDAPVAGDDAYDVYEDSSINGNVITDAAGEDTDVDNGDTLYATLVSGPAYGALTRFDSDGSFTYVADDNHWDSLAPGETEDVTFTYEIKDAVGVTDQAVVTITVMGVNDAPALTVNDNSGALTEDASAPDLTATGSLSVADVDNGDSVTVDASYNDDAVWSGGTLTASQIAELTDGFTADTDSWDYTVANDDTQFLAEGEAVTFSYSVIATDEYGGSDSDWARRVKLLADDGASYDVFGDSVSISGDYAIVGAYLDDDNGSASGSAYIFYWDGSQWSQLAKLSADDGAGGDSFGYSVSISGDSAIVGAYWDDDDGHNSGSAYVFQWNDSANAWEQEAKLTADDGAEEDYFGNSVSISGDYAIVGAYEDDDNGSASGSAYIFHWDGSQWSQQAKLTADDGAGGDYFGNSVSISGDYAIVGAYGDDGAGADSGSAYVFQWNDSANAWEQQEKLTADDGANGDYFGFSVSISGDNAIVGSYFDDDNGSASGSAYIFQWNDSANSWEQQTKLTADDGANGDCFGYSVSISGDNAIVGAYGDDDNGSISGSAYIFQWNDSANAWEQQEKLTADDGALMDCFGRSVSISGHSAIVGSYWDDDSGDNSGSAYIFDDKVVITITGVNDAPTAVDDSGADFTVDEDSAFTTGSVLDNDTDPDATDILSVAAFDTTGTLGTVTDNGDGTFDYDPNGQFECLAVGETATDTFTYTITDSHGATDTATVTITITGANDDPVLTVNDNSGAVTEDASSPDLTATGILSVTDVDNGDSVTVDASYNDDAVWSGGTLTPSQIAELTGGFTADTDSWDYTVANDDTQFLADGETVTFSCDVIATDEHGGSDSATVTITITGVNDAPTAADGSVSTDEDVSYTFQAADFNFTDVDATDTLQYVKITSLDVAAVGTLTWNGVSVAENNEIPIDDINNGLLVFGPDENVYGTVDFEFQVSDGAAYSASHDMTITVDSVNDAPVISSPTSVTLDEDTSVAISGISVSDVDVDEGTGEVQVTLSVSDGSLSLAQTAGLSIDSGADGSSGVTFTGLLDDVNSALATVTYTPTANYFGADSLQISVNDLGNYGKGGPCVVNGAVDVSIVGVPEFDEFGKSYEQDYSNFSYAQTVEGGPLSTTHPASGIGDLIDFLSNEEMLPFNISEGEGSAHSPETAYQFGMLLHQAVFGENSEAQDEAWKGLSDLVSAKKHGPDEEWLGLEEFLHRLQEWTDGRTLDEILLVFNADEIKLAEWFNSLMDSTNAVSESGDGISADFSGEHVAAKSMVFGMDDMRFADLLLGDAGADRSFGSGEDLSRSNDSVCQVLDLGSVNFVDALAS